MAFPYNSLSDSEEVLQNDFVLIVYCHADSCLFIQWKRQITFDERKEIFLWAYQFSKERSVRNWVIDDEEIYIITSQERAWVANDWTEIIADSGIRKIAVCVPEDHYNALTTLTDFTQTAQKNYQRHSEAQHEVFTDYHTAMVWIRS